jgi:hypothetical protein
MRIWGDGRDCGKGRERVRAWGSKGGRRSGARRMGKGRGRGVGRPWLTWSEMCDVYDVYCSGDSGDLVGDAKQ